MVEVGVDVAVLEVKVLESLPFLVEAEVKVEVEVEVGIDAEVDLVVVEFVETSLFFLGFFLGRPGTAVGFDLGVGLINVSKFDVE